MTQPLETVTGSCLCKAVLFEADAPFLRFAHCHCTRCRKSTGSGHATNLYSLPELFRWVNGEDQLTRYDLPSARSFATVVCRVCGCPMPRRTRSGREIVIPAGALDRQPSLLPQARIFFESPAVWSCDSDDIPRSLNCPTRGARDRANFGGASSAEPVIDADGFVLPNSRLKRASGLAA
jgi:hypothetical protein